MLAAPLLLGQLPAAGPCWAATCSCTSALAPCLRLRLVRRCCCSGSCSCCWSLVGCSLVVALPLLLLLLLLFLDCFWRVRRSAAVSEAQCVAASNASMPSRCSTAPASCVQGETKQVHMCEPTLTTTGRGPHVRPCGHRLLHICSTSLLPALFSTTCWHLLCSK